MRLLLVIGSIAVAGWLGSCEPGTTTAYSGAGDFEPQLSAYGLFQGAPGDLLPAENVQLLELSATLFTDYAEKQRLLKLPMGTKLQARGNGLTVFPEGTLLAKTFYYFHDKRHPEQGKRIIETRLLLLQKGRWQLATYRWNAEQTEALLLVEGANVPVSWKDASGKRQMLNYHIPAGNECVTCHQSGGKNSPIGPKLRNLNRSVLRNGRKVNQLAYLQQHGVLSQMALSGISTLPDYTRTTLPLEKRVRAYLEINCAHCHQPTGFAAAQMLDFRYETPLTKTGLPERKWSAYSRMALEGTGHMPQIGTTVTDKTGLELLRKYVDNP